MKIKQKESPYYFNEGEIDKKIFEYEPSIFTTPNLYPKEFDIAFRGYLRLINLFREGNIHRNQVELKNADEIRRMFHNKSAQLLSENYKKIGINYTNDESREEVKRLSKTFYKKFCKKDDFFKIDNAFDAVEIANQQGLVFVD